MNKWHIAEDGNPKRCSAKTPDSCTATAFKEYGHFDSEKAAMDFFNKRSARHFGGEDGGGYLSETPAEAKAKYEKLMAEKNRKQQ